MGDRVARVLGGLALAGVLGDTALLWRVHREVGAVAEAIEAAAQRRAEGAHTPAARTLRAGEAAAEAPEERQQRREEVATEWRDNVLDEIVAWGEDEGIDQATVDAVTDELVSTVQAMAAIREDLREKRIEMPDARQQMRDEKDQSDERLDRLVGKERADALRERLRDTRPY